MFPQDVLGYELGIVSYKGTGKCNGSSFKYYDDLPDCEDTITEECPAPSPPDEKGWWPVIALRTEPGRDTKDILVICFYQLLADGSLVAWWINIEQ